MRILILLLLLIASTVQAKVPIGMDLHKVNYWVTSYPVFTDLQKSVGQWAWGGLSGISWGDDTTISYDANGYPLDVPQQIDGTDSYPVGIFNRNEAGNYVLLYDGTGTIDMPNISSVISVTSTEAGKIYFTILSTAETTSSIAYYRITSTNSGDNIRNIRILPVEYEGDEGSVPTFNADFKRGLEPFDTLRFMQITSTNENLEWDYTTKAIQTNGVTDWTDRSLTTDHGQGTSKGIAWEYVIELAEELDKDVWINVPPAVSDTYITNMATFFKNNLDSDLTIYLEHSNEEWNGGTYNHSNWLRNNAVDHVESYVIADLRAINDAYHTEDYGDCEITAGVDIWDSTCKALPEKMGYMFARTFRLWSAVFGSEMSSRVSRVEATFLKSPSYNQRILNIVEDEGQDVDVISPSGYFGLSTASRDALDALGVAVTTQDVLDYGLADMRDTKQDITDHATFANTNSLDLIAYESGQHWDSRDDNNTELNEALYDAQLDPQVYDIYIEWLEHWQDVGGGLWMAYNYVGPRESVHGSFGHLESYSQLDQDLMTVAPKYQALLDFNLSEILPTTYPAFLINNQPHILQ